MNTNRNHEHPDETNRRLQEMISEIESLLAQRQQPEPTATPPQPEPTATVEEAAVYSLPTNRMRQALARFDDLTDGDQVDQLLTLWGD